MKKGVWVVLSMVLLVSVVAMGCPPPVVEKPVLEPWKEEIVIGWTPPDITGAFMTATDWFYRSVEDAWRHGFNPRLITRSPASHIAFADQVAIIEDFIAMGVDVIVISPIEVEVIRPAVLRANEAGIPVIFVNLKTPIKGVEAVSYIGFDNEMSGEISAFAVVDYFGGPGVLGTGRKVETRPGEFLDLAWWQALYAGITPEERAGIRARGALLEGVAGGFFSVARLTGFHRTIDAFPGIEIVTTLPTDWSRAKAITATEDILMANPPGTIDFIWGASSEPSLGGMLAVEAAGRQGDVRVFSMSATGETAARIRDGRIQADVWHGFAEWGWYGTYFAIMAALGQNPPPIWDVRPRTIFVENTREFFPEPFLHPLDWDAVKEATRR
ncbi:MAG: Ribose import binding protein RbsB [Chloroflexi bacterium]|nr:Ribose import binding protein RbsB [Chloroflexota bacterium]